MKLLDEKGQLIYSDIDCTIPAYRGPIPAIEQSNVALGLLNLEYNESMLANLFN